MEQMKDGEEIKLKHTWIPFKRIQRILPMAVIASEDNKFAHPQTDLILKAIQLAIEESQEGKRKQRSKYYQPANSQKCFSMARIIMVKKRFEVLFHSSY